MKWLQQFGMRGVYNLPCSNLVWLVVLALSGVAPASWAEEYKVERGQLTFPYAPELIRLNAKERKYLTVNLSETPVTANQFDKIIKKMKADGKSVFAIGVVVNARSKDWPNEQTTAHIRAVKKRVDEILHGGNEKDAPGFAEKYGVRVNAVIPVIYEAGATLRYHHKGELVEVPLSLNSILFAINDHDYSLINAFDDLRPHIEQYLDDGKHLVTRSEYLQHLERKLQHLDGVIETLDEEITAYDEEITAYDEEIAADDAVIAKFDGELVELLLLKGLADGRTFVPTLAEGRENRRKIEEYFLAHRLELNEDFDSIAMLDTYQAYAPNLYRRACAAEDADSCKLLAFAYREGRGVVQDEQRALQLFRKACELGSAQACEIMNQ